IFDGDTPVQCPEDDVEVFLTRFKAVEDAVEKEGFVLEALFKDAELFAAKFYPEPGPLQVLDPAGPQIAPPVLLDPAAEGGFSQLAAGLLTLNPLVAVGLAFAVRVDTTLFGLLHLYVGACILHEARTSSHRSVET